MRIDWVSWLVAIILAALVALFVYDVACLGSS